MEEASKRGKMWSQVNGVGRKRGQMDMIHEYPVFLTELNDITLLLNCILIILNLSVINTFAASYLNTQGLNNSCLKSPASTLVDLREWAVSDSPLSL